MNSFWTKSKSGSMEKLTLNHDLVVQKHLYIILFTMCKIKLYFDVYNMLKHYLIIIKVTMVILKDQAYVFEYYLKIFPLANYLSMMHYLTTIHQAPPIPYNLPGGYI